MAFTDLGGIMRKMLLISFFDSKNLGDQLLSNALSRLFSSKFEVNKLDFTSIHSKNMRNKAESKPDENKKKIDKKRIIKTESIIYQILQSIYIFSKLSNPSRWSEVKKMI